MMRQLPWIADPANRNGRLPRTVEAANGNGTGLLRHLMRSSGAPRHPESPPVRLRRSRRVSDAFTAIPDLRRDRFSR